MDVAQVTPGPRPRGVWEVSPFDGGRGIDLKKYHFTP